MEHLELLDVLVNKWVRVTLTIFNECRLGVFQWQRKWIRIKGKKGSRRNFHSESILKYSVSLTQDQLSKVSDQNKGVTEVQWIWVSVCVCVCGIQWKKWKKNPQYFCEIIGGVSLVEELTYFIGLMDTEGIKLLRFNNANSPVLK